MFEMKVMRREGTRMKEMRREGMRMKEMREGTRREVMRREGTELLSLWLQRRWIHRVRRVASS